MPSFARESRYHRSSLVLVQRFRRSHPRILGHFSRVLLIRESDLCAKFSIEAIAAYALVLAHNTHYSCGVGSLFASEFSPGDGDEGIGVNFSCRSLPRIRSSTRCRELSGTDRTSLVGSGVRVGVGGDVFTSSRVAERSLVRRSISDCVRTFPPRRSIKSLVCCSDRSSGVSLEGVTLPPTIGIPFPGTGVADSKGFRRRSSERGVRKGPRVGNTRVRGIASGVASSEAFVG